MKIEIPEGFFPPPGVAFSTDEQKMLGVAMHNAGLIALDFVCGKSCECGGCEQPESKWHGGCWRGNYRLAPPTPRKVGPFESVHDFDTFQTATGTAVNKVIDAANSAGIKRVRVTVKATAEEIL